MGIPSNAQPETRRSLLTELVGCNTTQAPVSDVVTFRVSCVLWLSAPLVPCSVSAKLPVDALAGTAKVTCTEAFALMVSGEAGEGTTPLGEPVNATETDPENPFDPATETVKGAVVVPAIALTEDVETEMEKSAAGGGGEDVEPPPPQPTSSAAATRAIKEATCELALAICSTSHQVLLTTFY